MRRLFVTGTDTGVGKTEVACALIAAWRRSGRKVAAMKPIETGCERRDGKLFATDGARLATVAKCDPGLVCPERYAVPAAPRVAATLEAREIDFSRLDRSFAALQHGVEAIVIEGVGGLLVPLDRSLYAVDLAARWRAPLLIVARASLGTINHTLLTLEAARARRLSIAGVILNRAFETSGADEEANGAQIAELGAVKVFGTLPHLPTGYSEETLAATARAHLDLEQLWATLYTESG